MRHSRWSRLRLRSQHFWWRTKRVIIFGSVVALCAGGAYALHAQNEIGAYVNDKMARFAKTTGFALEHILVAERTNSDPAELWKAIEATPGTPITALDLEAIRARVNTLPWVKHSAVERLLPHTLLVTLTERAAYARLQENNTHILIDETGHRIGAIPATAYKNLPLLIGKGAVAGLPLLEKIVQEPQLHSRFGALQFVQERRWDLILVNGTTIKLPQNEPLFALSKAWAQILPLLEKEPVPRVIDLRLPDRLIFEPAPEAVAPEES